MRLLDNTLKSFLKFLFEGTALPPNFLEHPNATKLSNLMASLGFNLPELISSSNIKENEKIAIVVALLKEGYSAHQLFKFLNWRNFEALVAALFDKGDYFVEKNFRFQNEGRSNEIDVLAFKFPNLFLIDCKFHKKDSPSSLRNAALKQRERVINFIEAFPVISDYIIRKLTLPPNKQIFAIPVIVSWYETELKIAERIPLVPFRLLMGFMEEIDEIRDNIYHLKIKVM